MFNALRICLLPNRRGIVLVRKSVLEIIQNLLNLISDNTNILEGIKQMDACISSEDEGKAVLRLS